MPWPFISTSTLIETITLPTHPLSYDASKSFNAKPLHILKFILKYLHANSFYITASMQQSLPSTFIYIGAVTVLDHHLPLIALQSHPLRSLLITLRKFYPICDDQFLVKPLPMPSICQTPFTLEFKNNECLQFKYIQLFDFSYQRVSIVWRPNTKYV